MARSAAGELVGEIAVAEDDCGRGVEMGRVEPTRRLRQSAEAGNDVAVVDDDGSTVRRRALKRRLLLWLVGSAVGVLMVALPDDDDRVFSISEAHGPSLVDLLGMAVLIGAWLPIVALLWSQRGMLRRRERALAAGAALVGAVVLVVTIALDLGAAWVVGVALLLVAQVIVIRSSRASAGAGS